jgi:hypothetical protein
LHAENIFVGFVVPENKIFYAALQVTSLYNIFVQIHQGLFGQLLHIIKYGKW